jgi:hypothetical protein
VTPWLPWMLMGQAPGHVLYESVTYNGCGLDKLKPQVVAHMKKYHPEMLEPPSMDSFNQPNLSSLEVYAKTQKPAPMPKG